MILAEKSNMEGNEILIIIVIHLFILSLINEKFTNFLKLNLQSLYESKRDFWILKIFLWKQSWRDSFKNFLERNLKNLREHETEKNKEKLRERGVINLTIFCGIVTATFSGADLFLLLNNAGNDDAILLLSWTNFLEKLIWKEPLNNLLLVGKAIFNHGFGFIFSGLFLSLGSKFWHDLLDILFEAKRLRSKINDKRTFETESADEVQEFALTFNSKLRKLAIGQNQLSLNDPDILYITHSDRIIDGRLMNCIAVFVKHNSKAKIPNKLKVRLEKSGFETFVPVIKFEVDDIPKVTFGEGRLRKVGSFAGGSSCCVLTNNDGQYYLLSCSHVFSGGRLVENLKEWDEDKNIRVEERNKFIGTVKVAFIDSFFDVSLIDITEKIEDYDADIKPTAVSQVADISLKMKMFFQASHSNSLDDTNDIGFVSTILSETQMIPVQYRDGNIIDFGGLIEISSTINVISPAPTEEGDSGGLVYDENNKAVAMLIASTDTHSYAIPIRKIIEKFKDKNISLLTNFQNLNRSVL